MPLTKVKCHSTNIKDLHYGILSCFPSMIWSPRKLVPLLTFVISLSTHRSLSEWSCASISLELPVSETGLGSVSPAVWKWLEVYWFHIYHQNTVCFFCLPYAVVCMLLGAIFFLDNYRNKRFTSVFWEFGIDKRIGMSHVALLKGTVSFRV